MTFWWANLKRFGMHSGQLVQLFISNDCKLWCSLKQCKSVSVVLSTKWQLTTCHKSGSVLSMQLEDHANKIFLSSNHYKISCVTLVYFHRFKITVKCWQCVKLNIGKLCAEEITYNIPQCLESEELYYEILCEEIEILYVLISNYFCIWFPAYSTDFLKLTFLWINVFWIQFFQL
jgi:hypothetical protein